MPIRNFGTFFFLCHGFIFHKPWIILLTFTRGGELIGMQSGGRAFLDCSLRALYKEMKIKDGRMIGEECDSQCGSLSNDRLKR